MALSDKNIVITPNIGSSSDPKIVFSGADSSTSAQNITLNVYPTNNGTLSFEGSAGQLLSIGNSLTGTVYSVNDISGIPSIEVLDTGLVKLAQYGGTVLIGGSSSDGTSKLQVSGGPSRFGNIYVGYGTYKNSIRPIDDNNLNLDTPSGYTSSGTSLRAPIFYDSENTAYFADPTSTSIFNVIGFNGTSANAFGSYWAGTSGYPAYQYVGGNSRFGFSSTSGAVDVYTDGVFYCGAENYSGNRLVLFEDTWLNGKHFGSDGNTYSNSSMRAPIFYDSDNTGYYCDPSGGTNLNGDLTSTQIYTREWFRNNNNNTGLYNQTNGNHFYSRGVANWAITANGTASVNLEFRYNHESTYRGSVYADGSGIGLLGSSGSWRVRVVDDDWVDFSGSSIRAQRLYDNNDTNYYLDPNGSSNFNTTVTGYMWFRSNRNTSSDSPPLQAYSSDGGGAIMAFHRGGQYAINFGLDSDNVIRFGGWSAGANRLQMDMSGNLTMAGNVTAYSDIRLKENIEVITNALNKVKQIRGVTFTRNDQEDKTIRYAGVIAQEVEEVLPEVVSEDNSGVKNVAYGNITALLIEAIKEQQSEIDELRALVKQLLAK